MKSNDKLHEHLEIINNLNDSIDRLLEEDIINENIGRLIVPAIKVAGEYGGEIVDYFGDIIRGKSDDVKNTISDLEEIEDEDEKKALEKKLKKQLKDLDRELDKIESRIYRKFGKTHPIEGLEGEAQIVPYTEILIDFDSPVTLEVKTDKYSDPLTKTISDEIYFDLVTQKSSRGGIIFNLRNKSELRPFDSLLMYPRKLKEGPQLVKLQPVKGRFTGEVTEAYIDILKLS
jgi:chaperonin cofactor prefoldin